MNPDRPDVNVPRFQRIRNAEAARWAWFGVSGVLITLSVLFLNIGLTHLDPGNAFGLGYGIAAAILLVGAAAYGFRRRTMRLASRWRWGRSRSWLYLHLYGGSLFLLLMLVHGGLRLPTSAMGVSLYVLSLWTVLTGWLGLALQQYLPRVLSSALSIEVNYDRIPELVDDLRERAEQVSVDAAEPVRDLYRRVVEPRLIRPERSWYYLVDATGSIHTRLREFEYVRRFLADTERLPLDELESLYRAKLELDAHWSLQFPLRAWLHLHVPTSLVLFGLLVVHVISVVYY